MGIEALTEKEKETLRLLVSGYDAKSMASHLGLSVHTINERLREARRKMAVSSSREAARQLRAVERTAPDYPVPAFLGDAATTAAAEDRPVPAKTNRMLRTLGWIFGGIIMSVSLALVALSSLGGNASAPAPIQSAPASSAAESAPVRAAREWLSLVDRGDWMASWNATTQSFKELNTVDMWTKVSEEGRAPLGAARSRVLISEQHVPAPPHGYSMVKFRTDYANKAAAIETVSLARESNQWRVAGVTVEWE
ncbi:MAG: DUF4019 domain-containing protein [Sphingopyxis sp.]|uniref:helix-turn-helix domain-containing protein n=1 Tax=Sphingopyxis sp. TaxID=1908224 RepID=UPI002ABCE833|nr:DUF4019 domain-containing protein [Sphingopyxis sp.]MDZ3830542.1 DUF4019 domain-containing protein [Sphingopyxis sp.]